MPRLVVKRSSVVFVFLAITLATSQPAVHPTEAVALPTAVVDSVEHPDSVLPGQVFPVIITVNYSASFLADVGVWDTHAGLMIQSITLISSFTGPGKTNFTFHLMAPLSLGEWNLVAVTRIWWQDAWYLDPNGGTSPFAVTVSDKFRVSFSSQAPNTTITIDGSSYTITRQQPIIVELSTGRHTVQASEIIAVGDGARYVFAGWNDGVSSNPRVILATRNLNIAAEYRLQFRLNVGPGNGRVYGSGWYDSGSIAYAAAIPAFDSTSRPFTNHIVFVKWGLDVSSTTPVTTVLMNSAKTAQAEWRISSNEIDFSGIAYAILLAAVPLVARAAYLAIRHHRRRYASRSVGRLLRLPLLAVLLVLPAFVPQVAGQLLQQSLRSNVHVGDADWYYWKHPSSDTCILWLGGGISQETVIGYNYYWINPYDYESFGTIRFLQDLAKYYCMVALQKGSYAQYNPAADRTIYQELYQIQSTIISELHSWIRNQGYRHVFIVGYSVGGQAAAMEIALRDSKAWTSQDGVVLITTPFQLSIIQHAHEVRTNFALVYGGNLPDFVATGKGFYDNAPPEGWHGASYIHKELHVLAEVGHEIWTVRATGEYTERGVNLVAGFIERSKALQFKVESPSSTAGDNTRMVSVSSPTTVEPNEIFYLKGNVTGPSQGMVALAYDVASGRPISSAYVIPSQVGGNLSLTVPSNPNATELSLTIVLLANENGWKVISRAYNTKIDVSHGVVLQLDTQVPRLDVQVDGASYQTNADGTLELRLPRGNHDLQLPPFVNLDNETKITFVGWSDSPSQANRNVYLMADTKLTALYKTQYYVAVSSQYGTVTGTGWHDQNSTIEVSVAPPLITQADVAFSGWKGNSYPAEPSILVLVDSAKHIQVVWTPINRLQPVNGPPSIVFLLSSVTLFLLLLYANIVLSKSVRRSEN